MSSRWTQEQYEAYVRSQGAVPEVMKPRAVGLSTTEQAKIIQKTQTGAEKQESPLEALFLSLWTKAGGPLLEREVELIHERKFRVDFVHEPSKYTIELQGVRDHASVKGLHRDTEKQWQLIRQGYRPIVWTRKQVNEENIRSLIKLIEKACR